VAKPEWGKKHVCTSCGAPFYDLKRKSIACPGCGEEQKQASSKSRASAPGPKPARVPAPPPAPAVAELADDAEDLVSTDDLALDDDDDEDDIAESRDDDEEIVAAAPAPVDSDGDDILADGSGLMSEDEEESLEAIDDSEET
jgi:hypothetical protein